MTTAVDSTGKKISAGDTVLHRGTQHIISEIMASGQILLSGLSEPISGSEVDLQPDMELPGELRPGAYNVNIPNHLREDMVNFKKKWGKGLEKNANKEFESEFDRIIGGLVISCELLEISPSDANNCEFEKGVHKCEMRKGPLTCVYNTTIDPSRDSCVFCGEPHERK